MASGKKLINAPDDVVNESLSGLCLLYPQLEYHPSKRVVLSPDWKTRSGKVAIVSGGGGGHEPYAAGFVGSGLLTGAITGPVFASPPSNHILHALQCVSTNNTAGILVIVPNYTGDCLNFGTAIEKARNNGVSVTELTVGEDCSIPMSELGRTGRRGLVGMLFVGKVAGALAERGLNLSSVAQYAEIVTNNVATYAVGLTACALPGQGRMFHVLDDEMEIGLGVHGEAGYKRMKLTSASQVVSLMLQHILKTLSLINGESVAVIVNNFGATSQLEQGIVVHEVVMQLGCRGIQPLRVYAGPLMTSLDGAGVQISILRLGDHHGTSLVSCLDQATDAPCWPGSVYSVSLLSRGVQGTFKPASTGDANKKIAKVGPTLNEEGENLLRKCLKRACMAITAKENYINELDTGCGDGDCGTTMRRLAEGISLSLENLPLSHPSSVLTALSAIAEETMGGTSGAIYSLMFTTAAAELKLPQCGQVCPLTWSQAWRGGIDGILRYSKARLGDRTMLDALDPACREFESNDFSGGLRRKALEKIAKAAQDGCEGTKHMEARAGRASYVKQTTFLQKVDAGAFAVATWITAIVSTMLESYD
ncbi:triokinase/FMN cyclase-like isoform X2 [Neodiprion pinetum]|uniref:Triokinase/FMN cyclase n=1 Tax=Neodiprion lecontei TaxID=441921 RepID=A0ABM3FDS6_NEOLC|nr:triokinase/FMN cyclase-like isoform X2 [Neodiprion fabricii]XP_046471153.1 triokinase/FMN cyclase-like isoform X2 [Neodiprion pinetum]XP_046586162.1 triokinase/FMN cyclase isoform X2 [Neodiprion lecontei]